jgi:Leucine-rich repeat (LRR) protein
MIHLKFFRIFLANNHLTAIDSEAFAGLTLLSYIDLSCNQLESIDYDSFKGLRNLRFVGLHCNKFKSLDLLNFNSIFKTTKKNHLSLYI